MRINCFPSERFLVLILLAMAVVAGWFTLHRHEGYSVTLKSYQELYTPAESPRIVGFEIDSDGKMTIDLVNLPDRNWTVSRFDNNHVAQTQTSVLRPEFTLEPGVHRYVVVGSETLSEFEIQITWGPGIPRPVVSRSTIPISKTAPYAISDFIPATSEYASREVSMARSLMIEDVPGKDTASILTRAQVTAALLHNSLEPFRGNPDSRMRSMSGFRQYEEALAGRSGVYCANHSEIFAFFANVLDIPTRVVDVSGRLDGVDLGAHTFVEAYIPELLQWIYVDLQLNIAGITDANGRYLNSAELLHRIVSESTDNLIVIELRDRQFFPVPYSDRSAVIETVLPF